MVKMEKEFLPYAESLELKELGFDKPCGAFFHMGDTKVFQETTKWDVSNEHHYYDGEKILCCAPTYRQAFRWFREKYDIQYWLHDGGYLGKAFIKITGYKHDKFYFSSSEPMEYEEAELACLRKLIEIVKTKKI